MEELVELQVLAEMRIFVELLVAAVIRSVAFMIALEQADDPVLNFFSDTSQAHVIA